MHFLQELVQDYLILAHPQADLPQIKHAEEITHGDKEEISTGKSAANNTVAIVMANPIAKEMAEEYGITPRKTASILDTFSCVFQGVIPYGAQMLVAISAVNELGGEISAFQIMPKLFYPMLLLLSSLITIMRGSDRTGA